MRTLKNAHQVGHRIKACAVRTNVRAKTSAGPQAAIGTTIFNLFSAIAAVTAENVNIKSTDVLLKQ
jgi:hypothetical protein